MKKLTLIAALLAVLALLVTGCPGEGEKTGEEYDIDIAEVFETASGDTQDKAKVTISGDAVTFSLNSGEELWGELVTPEDSRWDISKYKGIKFEYKATGNATVFIQDTEGIFIFAVASDGWAAVASVDEWTELKLPFSILYQQLGENDEPWFGSIHKFGNLPVVKLCFQIAEADTNTKFEIRNLIAYN